MCAPFHTYSIVELHSNLGSLQVSNLTITFIPIAASFNTSAHCHVALLISPVILYFLGGEGRGGVAYQMQNSTPAVPKHPHWVQISAPLLPFFPLSNTRQRQKGDSKFFHNKFCGNQNKNASSNLVLQIFEWFWL